MNYRSITVFIDQEESSQRLIEFAVTVAAKQDAHLTGMYLSFVPPPVYDMYSGLGPLYVEWDQFDADRSKSCEEQLRRSAKLAGVNVDWTVCKNINRRLALGQVRSTDLTIIAQRVPGNTDLSQGFYDSLVLKAGRPVLFLPQIGNSPAEFNKIIVAWDGGREATRAVADALPFLRKAKQVQVLSAISGGDKVHDLPNFDIATYLTRHGVHVTIEKNNQIPADPAQLLRARISSSGADLLVMGAYGHNRFGEIAFGGTTREVMEKMTVPVLMSH